MSAHSLWLHLVSVHADPMATCRTSDDNYAQHQAEHRGPGTIRNHPAGDLQWTESTAKAVLQEMIENP